MRTSVIVMAIMAAAIATTEAQKMDTTLRLSIQVGAGWTHYANNLVVGHDDVKNDFFGSSVRLMWEPGHRLSIGIESGYYTLYQVALRADGGTASMAVIPVLANIRMHIVKGFYLTGGTGVVIMNGVVTSPSNDSNSTVMSYSNVQLSGLYLHRLTEQFSVGGEMKFMWIDKTNDFVYSLQAVASYRF